MPGPTAVGGRRGVCEGRPGTRPEGIAVDRRSRGFFVSITADGDLIADRSTATRWSPSSAAPGAVRGCIAVRHGLLYVAGGPTGTITVYDLATRQPVATFETGTGGFLNDSR